MAFVFHHHQGVYPKISLSLGRTRFMFKVLQSFWNLIGGPLPVVPSCLWNFKAIGVFFPNYTQLLNCEKSVGNLLVAKRKTYHSKYKHGLPVTFMGRILRPGDRLWTALPIDCISLHDCWWPEDTRNQGPFSISDKTSCCKIPWSLEAVRFVSRIRENCNMAISDGQLKYHQIRHPRWKHFL